MIFDGTLQQETRDVHAIDERIRHKINAEILLLWREREREASRGGRKKERVRVFRSLLEVEGRACILHVMLYYVSPACPGRSRLGDRETTVSAVRCVFCVPHDSSKREAPHISEGCGFRLCSSEEMRRSDLGTGGGGLALGYSTIGSICILSLAGGGGYTLASAFIQWRGEEDDCWWLASVGIGGGGREAMGWRFSPACGV